MNWTGGSRKRVCKSSELQQYFSKVAQTRISTNGVQGYAQAHHNRSTADGTTRDNSEVPSTLTASRNMIANPEAKSVPYCGTEAENRAVRNADPNFKQMRSREAMTPLRESTEIPNFLTSPDKLSSTPSFKPKVVHQSDFSTAPGHAFSTKNSSASSTPPTAAKPVQTDRIDLDDSDSRPPHPNKPHLETPTENESPVLWTSPMKTPINIRTPRFHNTYSERSKWDQSPKEVSHLTSPKDDFPIRENIASCSEYRDVQAEDIIKEWVDLDPSGSRQDGSVGDSDNDDQNTGKNMNPSVVEGRDETTVAKKGKRKARKKTRKHFSCVSFSKTWWIRKGCCVVIQKVKIKIKDAATQTD